MDGDRLAVPASGSSISGDRIAWHRVTLYVLGATLVFRLVYLALVPLDLVHDEAYYWDWSRQLDWGYYSKPPMIAWLIGLSTRLGGSTELMVRLPAAVLSVAGLGFVYLLGARLYHPRVGFWAMLLSLATPGNAALGLIMTIDAPLLLFWSAGLYTLWRMLERKGDRWGWMAASVLVVGAGLLTKQTALGLLGGAGLFLLVSPEDRHQLRRPEIWVWGFASLAMLTPVLWWNAQHDWITLQHTSGHFATSSPTLLRRLLLCLEFLATQLGVISPLSWLLGIGVLTAAMRRWFRLGRRERFLLCYSAVPLAAVVLLSFKQRVEPNWPAPFYIAAAVLVSAWLCGQVTGNPDWRPGVLNLPRAATTGAVCTLLVYAMPFALPMLGLAGTRLDPVVRLRGWQELGAAVGERIIELPHAEQTFVLTTAGRKATSELAFYLPGQPRVYQWKTGQAVHSQYDLWNGPQDKRGWNAVIVSEPGTPLPAALTAGFRNTRPGATVEVEVGNGRHHRYRLWHAENFQGFPPIRYVAEAPH